MSKLTFCGVAAGDQLGNLEYAVDDAAITKFRRLAGCHAHYANLMADDCKAGLIKRCGPLRLTTLWRRLEFLRPPLPGRRIQVGAWLKEIRDAGGRQWLRVSAFSVDEIGTEILRSEAAFVIGHRPAEPRLASPPTIAVEPQNCATRADAPVGSTFNLGAITLPAAADLVAYRRWHADTLGLPQSADGNGLVDIAAGWLEGRVGQHLGDNFRWGGSLTLSFLAPASSDATITADATVIANDAGPTGTVGIRWIVNLHDDRGVRIAVGEVSAQNPSPRLI